MSGRDLLRTISFLFIYTSKSECCYIMRVLLITGEEWNDAVYGNNVLTNWFEGFDAEFAYDLS